MLPKKHRDPSAIRVGTWNTEWANPSSIRGNVISDNLDVSNCDVLCVTEGFAAILPDGGHLVDAGEDCGYPICKGRRRVLLWSKQLWTPHNDAVGSADLPSGRFVAGITETLSGARLTVVGTCIPWSGPRVRHGRRDRRLWKDHEAWLAGSAGLLSRIPESQTIALGNFNQRTHGNTLR